MATTTKRKRVNEQVRKAATSSELAPLYAVAGLTEVVAERLLAAATESRQLVNDRIAALRAYSDERVARATDRVNEAGEKLNQATGELNGRSLPDLVRGMPEFTKQQLARIGEYADDRRAKAGKTYANLAGRGKLGVEGVLGEAAGSLDPVLERLQDGVAKLRETVAGKAEAPTAPRTAKKATPAE